MQRDVWVLPENSKILREIEKRLRQPLTADASNLETLMSITNTWNIKALHEALSTSALVTDGRAEVNLVGTIDQSLQVTMTKHGDLPIYLAIQGEQILVEAALFPVSAVKDVAEFNHTVLRSRSLFPLSALAIEQDGDGNEQYVMYGALSSASRLESVVTEIDTLADNIINAAQAFESVYSK